MLDIKEWCSQHLTNCKPIKKNNIIAKGFAKHAAICEENITITQYPAEIWTHLIMLCTNIQRIRVIFFVFVMIHRIEHLHLLFLS